MRENYQIRKEGIQRPREDRIELYEGLLNCAEAASSYVGSSYGHVPTEENVLNEISQGTMTSTRSSQRHLFSGVAPIFSKSRERVFLQTDSRLVNFAQEEAKRRAREAGMDV